MIIPAGIWHNVINTGDGPLNLYSIRPVTPTAPCDRADAEAAEHDH